MNPRVSTVFGSSLQCAVLPISCSNPILQE
jgi:hypothetical protein